MEKKKIYTAVIGIAALLMFFVATFGEEVSVVAATIGIIIFIWACFDLYKSAAEENKIIASAAPKITGDEGRISRLELLNEKDGVLKFWDLYSRTSVLIGRDIGQNDVDINLAETEYASMVDVEHAVLNYADGDWYVEDLGSKNGIAVKKVFDGRRYKLSADQPCKLDAGDIIIVGLSRLRIC